MSDDFLGMQLTPEKPEKINYVEPGMIEVAGKRYHIEVNLGGAWRKISDITDKEGELSGRTDFTNAVVKLLREQGEAIKWGSFDSVGLSILSEKEVSIIEKPASSNQSRVIKVSDDPAVAFIEVIRTISWLSAMIPTGVPSSSVEGTGKDLKKSVSLSPPAVAQKVERVKNQADAKELLVEEAELFERMGEAVDSPSLKERCKRQKENYETVTQDLPEQEEELQQTVAKRLKESQALKQEVAEEIGPFSSHPALYLQLTEGLDRQEAIRRAQLEGPHTELSSELNWLKERAATLVPDLRQREGVPPDLLERLEAIAQGREEPDQEVFEEFSQWYPAKQMVPPEPPPLPAASRWQWVASFFKGWGGQKEPEVSASFDDQVEKPTFRTLNGKIYSLLSKALTKLSAIIESDLPGAETLKPSALAIRKEMDEAVQTGDLSQARALLLRSDVLEKQWLSIVPSSELPEIEPQALQKPIPLPEREPIEKPTVEQVRAHQKYQPDLALLLESKNLLPASSLLKTETESIIKNLEEAIEKPETPVEGLDALKQRLAKAFENQVGVPEEMMEKLTASERLKAAPRIGGLLEQCRRLIRHDDEGLSLVDVKGRPSEEQVTALENIRKEAEGLSEALEETLLDAKRPSLREPEKIEALAKQTKDLSTRLAALLKEVPAERRTRMQEVFLLEAQGKSRQEAMQAVKAEEKRAQWVLARMQAYNDPSFKDRLADWLEKEVPKKLVREKDNWDANDLLTLYKNMPQSSNTNYAQNLTQGLLASLANPKEGKTIKAALVRVFQAISESQKEMMAKELEREIQAASGAAQELSRVLFQKASEKEKEILFEFTPSQRAEWVSSDALSAESLKRLAPDMLLQELVLRASGFEGKKGDAVREAILGKLQISPEGKKYSSFDPGTLFSETQSLLRGVSPGLVATTIMPIITSALDEAHCSDALKKEVMGRMIAHMSPEAFVKYHDSVGEKRDEILTLRLEARRPAQEEIAEVHAKEKLAATEKEKKDVKETSEALKALRGLSTSSKDRLVFQEGKIQAVKKKDADKEAQKQAFQEIIASVREGFEKARPNILVLDNLRNTAWGRKMLKVGDNQNVFDALYREILEATTQELSYEMNQKMVQFRDQVGLDKPLKSTRSMSVQELTEKIETAVAKMKNEPHEEKLNNFLNGVDLALKRGTPDEQLLQCWERFMEIKEIPEAAQSVYEDLRKWITDEIAHHSNRVSNFVASSILEGSSLEESIRIKERFVRMAEYAYDSGNIGLVVAILAALRHKSVMRLDPEQKLLGSEEQKILEGFDKIFQAGQATMESFQPYINQYFALKSLRASTEPVKEMEKQIDEAEKFWKSGQFSKLQNQVDLFKALSLEGVSEKAKSTLETLTRNVQSVGQIKAKRHGQIIEKILSKKSPDDQKQAMKDYFARAAEHLAKQEYQEYYTIMKACYDVKVKEILFKITGSKDNEDLELNNTFLAPWWEIKKEIEEFKPSVKAPGGPITPALGPYLTRLEFASNTPERYEWVSKELSDLLKLIPTPSAPAEKTGVSEIVAAQEGVISDYELDKKSEALRPNL